MAAHTLLSPDPRVLSSDDETRAIDIRLPSGEELQQHQAHERIDVLVAKVAGGVSGDREA